MDFFQKHDKALRKGRLLQAAATIFVHFSEKGYTHSDALNEAVEKALWLEFKIDNSLEF